MGSGGSKTVEQCVEGVIWGLVRGTDGRLDEPANEELLDTSSSNIIWEIKSKRKEYRSTWHVVRGGGQREIRTALWWSNLNKTDYLEEKGVRRDDNLKTDLEKQDGVTLSVFKYVRIEQVASCCTPDNELAHNGANFSTVWGNIAQ